MVFELTRRSAQLQSALLPSVVTKISTVISPPLRNSILFGSAAALLYKNRNKFYPPNLPTPDSSFSEPLPDGSLGCPFLGNIAFFTKVGDRKPAPAHSTGCNPACPAILESSTCTSREPSVVISGMSNVKRVFNQEFKLVKTGMLSKSFAEMFGGESLLFATNPDRHQFLRRLVGKSRLRNRSTSPCRH
ncbi:LOW QUALITY PROTEIN: hypothetical protein ACHAW5_001211 [Stephanodiscus triporus]|uniref:Cytochrome P450 n=1 Tax=Stephanodiscus triporus TaxID=2934178 RepID=A0ABD3N396_9STRA